MNVPFFSVVIPTYNRIDDLKKTINSVLKQSFVDFEIIISDDCSSDLTQDWCEGLNIKKIHYFRQNKNLGIALNWAFGINQANGRYVCILMDDDGYYPDFLQVRYEQIIKYPNADLIYSGYSEIVNGNCVSSLSLPVKFPILVSGPELIHHLLRSPRWIGSFAIEKNKLCNVISESIGYGLVLDFALLLKIAFVKDSCAVLVPGCSFWMSKHPGQTSNTRTLEMYNQAIKFLYDNYYYFPIKSRKLYREVIAEFLISKSRYLLKSNRIRSCFFLIVSFWYLPFSLIKHRLWIFRKIIFK
jgi:glycosyltransferase involved in cell wall biosynthesis